MNKLKFFQKKQIIIIILLLLIMAIIIIFYKKMDNIGKEKILSTSVEKTSKHDEEPKNKKLTPPILLNQKQNLINELESEKYADFQFQITLLNSQKEELQQKINNKKNLIKENKFMTRNKLFKLRCKQKKWAEQIFKIETEIKNYEDQCKRLMEYSEKN
ncbi:MAG: hypothetical protein Q8897_01915 [Sweet potato little leaf phytoplasma]|uniref:hypothetical protein n=1 Tax=Candidatus Phytoplasma australasiaticum TaxID=2754999 RepID=UPI00210A53FA|nr:hypothetical protein [Sweet potato little leaf phytoplasma]MDV3201648.1 hypothetical protein [Candidatus Phytoplasma australasiaticum]MDO7987325.1 hypothetical protein [Sweet potato little leaf phytoplasma]MDO8005549.1 hypothetical protein [Sweet potato little leaf phytoplasma]MDO8008881.1 hypothetical protein [Sweet potato little leaf phytoplasma]MDO8020547.1 hypothetical protein [Sweet potato little leaf phytoplasma]